MNSKNDVQLFFTECIKLLGSGFHPDTDFVNYINLRNGKRLFKIRDCKSYNLKMSQSFDFCNTNDLDLYEIAYEVYLVYYEKFKI